MGMAIGGSCVVGISYGAQPLLHAISSEVVPRRYRAIAQGACNVVRRDPLNEKDSYN